MKRRNFLSGLVVAAIAATTGLPLGYASAATITPTSSRLILGLSSAQPDATIDDFAVSSSGAWAVFSSTATNLVEDDENGVSDVFVMKMSSGVITRISVAADGSELSDDSVNPTICGSGQFVAFQTAADIDLLNDYNFGQDIYVTNRDADGDGQFDEFSSEGAVTQSLMSVGSTGLTTSDGAINPAISDDCAWVAYDTTDALEDADANSTTDVYVHSTNNADTTFDEDGLLLSSVNIQVSSGVANEEGGGGYLPTLSADGELVAFYTRGVDLVEASEGRQGAILIDRDADDDDILDESADGATEREYISANDAEEPSAGDPDDSAPMSMTPDGSCVAFKFVTGNDLDSVSNITASNGVYLRNRSAGTTRIVSYAPVLGTPLAANDASNPEVSDDCRFVAFDSEDGTLMAEDSNAKRDVLLHDVVLDRTFLVSRAADGTAAAGTSTAVQVGTVSVDGTVQVYVLSDATSLLGTSSDGSYTRPFRLNFNVAFPGAPRDMTATVRTGFARQVAVSWKAPAGSESLTYAGYKVLYRCGTTSTAAPCNGKWNSLGFTQVDDPTLHTSTTTFANKYFTLPVGTATKTVTIALRGVLNDDDATTGAQTSTTVTPIDLPKLSATALTLTAPTATTVTKPLTVKINSTAITTSNGSTASSYAVAYSTNQTTWTSVTAPTGGWKLNSAVKTVTGLKRLTKYYVRLTVTTDAGSASVVQSITTK